MEQFRFLEDPYYKDTHGKINITIHSTLYANDVIVMCKDKSSINILKKSQLTALVKAEQFCKWPQETSHLCTIF